VREVGAVWIWASALAAMRRGMVKEENVREVQQYSGARGGAAARHVAARRTQSMQQPRARRRNRRVIPVRHESGAACEARKVYGCAAQTCQTVQNVHCPSTRDASNEVYIINVVRNRGEGVV